MYDRGKELASSCYSLGGISKGSKLNVNDALCFPLSLQ